MRLPSSLLALCLLSCAQASPRPAAAPPALPPAPALPKPVLHLEPVESPPANPTTPERVHLGWKLFFDPRLSRDGSMRCESCHHPEQAWTSGRATDAKAGGKQNVRNAPTVQNLGEHKAGFYWDGRKATLEAVCEAAWTGQLGADPKQSAAALDADPKLHALFLRAFGAGADAQNVPMALAAFLRALQGGDSPWDRFDAGDAQAVGKQEEHGFDVFTQAGCALCHVPPLYSDAQFHNAGIGWDAAARAFKDHGRRDATGAPADDGRFKTPSLRDAARTGPWFHDGSAPTLEEAVDRMLAGGVPNPGLDVKLAPNTLSPEDRAALLAFLRSLSGRSTFGAPPAD